jgi:hypothetical protein
MRIGDMIFDSDTGSAARPVPFRPRPGTFNPTLGVYGAGTSAVSRPFPAPPPARPVAAPIRPVYMSQTADGGAMRAAERTRVRNTPEWQQRQYELQMARDFGVPVSLIRQSQSVSPSTPVAPPSVGTSGGTGGGGGGMTGPSFQELLDAIRGGYGAQRSALDAQLEAAIGAQGVRRGAASSAQTAASEQLSRILGELRAGAEASGRSVADVYSGAGQRLGSLMQDYERMLGERGAAGGRTLAAFGADASMAQPGGMGAADYLAAEQAALGRMGAGEQAYWAGRPQAYEGLAGDIGTQRALEYERLMGDIANQEQVARAQSEADRARLQREEEEAILQAQLQAWQLGARNQGGGSVAPQMMPIPPVFGGM